MSLMVLRPVELHARQVRVVLNWENTAAAPRLDLLLVLPGNNAGETGSARCIQFADPADPTDPARAVRHLGATEAVVSTDRAQVDLDAVPACHDQILIALSAAGGPVAAVPGARLRLIDTRTGAEILRLDLAAGPTDLVHLPGELCRRRGRWFYRPLGFGFADGLAGLGTRFAVPINEELLRPRSATADVPLVGPGGGGEQPERGASPAGVGGTPLGDVRLLPGASATIRRPRHEITAELTWKRTDKDLDLYALYIDSNGHEGVCYYRDQGFLDRPPYVCLTTGDRRRGREVIVVARPDLFRYILICAYSAVENGVGSFRGFGAVVEVDDQAGSVVQTPLYHRNSFSYWVAIARIDLSGEEEAVIEHVETYSRSRSERRPVLRRNGSFRMDAGPVEFKTR